MLTKLSRLYNTVKYLKAKQIIWRGIYLLPRYITPVQNSPEISDYQPENIFILRKKATNDFEVYTFLGESYNLNKVGWDNTSISKLWRYNLHYFDFLNQNNTSQNQIELQINIIENWIENNPFGNGTGWEPYPTALRIINWIKWHWRTSELTERAKLSLWNQIRWLESRPENHLLGNHLFVNAKALLFGSAFFVFDSDSKIYKTGNKILLKELDEQFLSDGAHFELSPMYHSLAMEDLLDLICISKKLPKGFSIIEITEKIKKGMSWLKTMIYSNNELSHFNDCANGIAPSYSELLNFAENLKIDFKNPEIVKFYNHNRSGFVVFKDEKSHLIADLGNVGPDYLPGHAHADTFSFELAVNGYRVIVNSGTSVYGTSLERLRQRGTSAHSTVQIDRENSSEVWSGFRVAKRARPFNIQINLINELSNIVNFRASHDGYKRLKNSPIHTREFNLSDNVWSIEDSVSGYGNCVISRFYLHPTIQVKENQFGLILSKNSEDLVFMTLDSNAEFTISEATYHDEFGTSKLNNCIQLKGISPCKLSVKLELL